eukprot:1047995-Ditylum_brightwellii.AAC.1
MKNRTERSIVEAYEKAHGRLKHAGYKPKLHWHDNEAPKGLKQFDINNKVTYKLVPPNVHRQNVAERAIRTSKKQFKAILGAVNPQCPIHLWCRMLNQAEMTLNMLRTCR